jgi:hypothetical protein
LRQRGLVVGAIAGHRHQLSLLLLAADQIHFVLRSRFREEIIHPGFSRDRGCGQRIVSGNHHGLDSHGAKLIEALAHSAFHDVLEMNHAEGTAVLGDYQRRSARAGDGFHGSLNFFGKHCAVLGQIFCNRVHRAFADLASIKVHA